MIVGVVPSGVKMILSVALNALALARAVCSATYSGLSAYRLALAISGARSALACSAAALARACAISKLRCAVSNSLAFCASITAFCASASCRSSSASDGLLPRLFLNPALRDADLALLLRLFGGCFGLGLELVLGRLFGVQPALGDRVQQLLGLLLRG